MWHLLAKPLLGVVADGVKGFVETKKLNGEVKIAKIKAEKKKQEDIPGQKRLLDYMINVHRANPYTKLAMRKKDGGLATIVGD